MHISDENVNVIPVSMTWNQEGREVLRSILLRAMKVSDTTFMSPREEEMLARLDRWLALVKTSSVSEGVLVRGFVYMNTNTDVSLCFVPVRVNHPESALKREFVLPV